MAQAKIALITGGNKGIGLETARQLGAQGITVLLGARDAARGREASEKLRAERIDAHPIALDVTDPASIARARDTIDAEFARLDILVNNAGVFLGAWNLPPSRASLADIRKTFDTNVFGLVEVTQAMLPLLRKSPAARIVNLSSILGSLAEHGDPNSSIYGMLTVGYNMTKAAVNMFTVNLAHELRDTPIKVNAAHPGWVKTDMGGEGAPMNVVDGAKTSVFLATLPADGPTGGYFHMKDRLRW
jgi:NAD(P)-dependent dehydrogenase (short-subunit alcohol dehydrogenase family)